MAEINTRIILRNDSAEAWATEAGAATPLKKGEAAVEIKDGKARVKVAIEDNKTFADAPYIGSEDAKVFQVELGSDETDIEAAINAVVNGAELNKGDIAIVKAGIAGDKKSYTSYVWGPVADGFAWTAMDGNYNASFVSFAFRMQKKSRYR